MSDLLIGLALAVFFIAVLPTCILSGRLILLKGKINRACKKNGAQVTWFRSPLAASKVQKGFDFLVAAGERRYHVTLISSRHRYSEYCFLSPTELVVNRKISINLIARGRGLRGMGIHNTVDFGLNQKTKEVDLTGQVPKGEEKVLLFYPVPKDVTWIAPGKGKVFLGAGDLFYNDYRLFTRSAFLAEIASPGKYLRRVDKWKEY